MKPSTYKASRISLSLFLESLQSDGLSERTLTAYRNDVNKFLRYFQLAPDDFDSSYLGALRIEHFESFLRGSNGRGPNVATLRRSVAAIRRFYKFMVDRGLLQHNPAETLSVRSVLTIPLTSERILWAFSYLNTPHAGSSQSDIIRHRRDELILLLMIFHGVRQVELTRLKLSHVARSGRTVSLILGKGRAIKLDPRLLARLRWYLSNRGSNATALFLRHPQMKAIDYASIQALFIELNVGAGVICSAKSLYETYLQLRLRPDEHQKLLNEILSNRPPEK